MYLLVTPTLVTKIVLHKLNGPHNKVLSHESWKGTVREKERLMEWEENKEGCGREQPE